MKRWTPEAEQRLDDYLDEIVALARSSGEADDDFVDELRQHIRSDAEESAGGVVTPQNLERALAAAGKPRDVLGMDSLRSGNGHGATQRDPVGDLVGAAKPYLVASGKPLLRVRIILGGVILPLLALGMEIFLISESGGGGIGVAPTVLHMFMILLVPALFVGLMSRSCPELDVASERASRVIAGALGYLLSISAAYAIFLIPVTPFALVGVLYFGIGLIGLAPAISLLCSVFMLARWMNYGLFLTPYGRRTLAWMGVGVLAAVVPLLGHWGLQAARHHHVVQVVHGGNEAQFNSLRTLRVIGVPDPSGSWGRNENLVTLWGGIFTGQSRWNREQRVGSDDLEQVAFRATGVVPDPNESGSPWYTTNLLSKRWNILNQQGREEVGTMIPGLSLASSTMSVDLVRDGLVDSGLSYTEWVLEFSNNNPEVNEARCVISIPPESVASRLTLWINGVECEAAFGGASQVKAAYQEVAIVRRQDPALLTNPAVGELFLQCFPVPAFGKMKVKVGITAPLHSLGGQSYQALPRIVEENFAIASDFTHQCMVEGPSAMGTEIPGLVATARDDGSHGLSGAVRHADLVVGGTVPSLALDGWAIPPLAQGQLGPYAATMESRAAAPKSGRKVWLVVDGSAGVGDAEIDWAALVNAFPEDATLNATFAHFTTEHWGGAGGREGLVAWLESREFGFGQRLVPALQEACARAAGSKGEVLVIHGPQPFEDSFEESLKATIRLSRRNGGALPIYMAAAAPGLNQLARSLVNCPEVRVVPVFTTFQESLEHFARVGSTSDIIRSYTLTHDEAPASTSGPHGTGSHVVRMAALNQIMKLLRSESPSETREAIDLAKRCRLVTPVSGAVVLENQAQYQEHGLDDGEAMDAVPAVPEPEEWLLLGVGTLALGIAWKCRRRVRPEVAAG